MSSLNIESEKVLAAAKKCPQAQITLETLFPEVFKAEAERLELLRLEEEKKTKEAAKYFNIGALKDYKSSYRFISDEKAKEMGFRNGDFLQIRGSVEYKDKAFYLDNIYNWELIKDTNGQLCLLPTKKV